MTVILLLIVMRQEYRIPMADRIECHEVQQALWTLHPTEQAYCIEEIEA